MTIREQVFESLDHALESGYDHIVSLAAGQVADDLADYDADLEGADRAEVLSAVHDWQASRAGL